MMRETPRTFVGTVTFRLEEQSLPEVVQAAFSEGFELLPGVEVSELDVTAGIVMVTAELPVDRGDVVAALGRVGCLVCG